MGRLQHKGRLHMHDAWVGFSLLDVWHKASPLPSPRRAASKTGARLEQRPRDGDRVEEALLK